MIFLVIILLDTDDYLQNIYHNKWGQMPSGHVFLAIYNKMVYLNLYLQSRVKNLYMID